MAKKNILFIVMTVLLLIVAAIYWFVGADSRKANALYKEANGYYYGLGDTLIDKERAAELYRKSADLGNDIAMIKLGMLYQLENNGVKRDYSKAIELFRKALLLGHDV